MVDLEFKHLKLPGRAGELQAQADKARLAKELGDNYESYHDFLAAEARKHGRPERKDFETHEAWAAAYERVEECVRAEATLRACRAVRMRLGAPDDGGVPLVDDEDRLVSVVAAESGRATS